MENEIAKPVLKKMRYFRTKHGENMFNLFRKGCLLALLAPLCIMNSSLMAWEESCGCESNRLYVGAFGGGLRSNSTKLTQMGTAFFTEAEGGPLAVLAEGNTEKKWSGFGGAQIGYEWSRSPGSGYCGCSSWTLAPAAEIEAFFYSHKKKGHLINTTDRLPEHDFLNSFQMNTGVILANAVFSLNNSGWCGFSPYIGGGLGAARISIRHAKSLQVSPEEPGINHFNSKRSDSSWAFAAQAKAGLRYNICKSFHIFGEYRYVYLDSSNYILGSTVDPSHAPTSPWNLKMHNAQYNAFVVGIQYDL